MKTVKFFMMKKDNKKKDLSALNTQYIKAFCSKFGGATTYDANGFWVSPSGELFEDQTVVCEIFVDMKKVFGDNKRAMFSYFKGMAKRYQKEADQEAVSVVIDGKAFIIE